MTATNELRQMLDERGIEYRVYDEPDESIICTQWDACGFLWDADDREERIYLSADRLITPEQAIAATLGTGTCRLKPWEMERDTGFYDCMQCGCGYVADVSDWAEWHFCPICGRKVVDE